jgi:hypothetical protein
VHILVKHIKTQVHGENYIDSPNLGPILNVYIYYAYTKLWSDETLALAANRIKRLLCENIYYHRYSDRSSWCLNSSDLQSLRI